MQEINSDRGQYVLLRERRDEDALQVNEQPQNKFFSTQKLNSFVERNAFSVGLALGLLGAGAVAFGVITSAQDQRPLPDLNSTSPWTSNASAIIKAASAFPVSVDGQCASNGRSCPSDLFCCSQYGWCGSSSGHCGSGCQAGYSFDSQCSAPSSAAPAPAPPPSGSAPVSTDGQCASNGRSCPSDLFCCSQYGWCGSSSGHCGSGCQSGFSFNKQCAAPANSPAPVTPAPPAPSAGSTVVSTDGQCASNGKSCPSDLFCCSQYGWCGSSSGHCGTGCQSGFSFNKQCNAPTSSPAPVTPAPPAPSAGSTVVSTDGQCASNGKSCPSDLFCCSQYGWCGSSSGHCGAGCQSGFSFNKQCNAPTSSPAPVTPPSTSTGTTGSTSSSNIAISTDTTCGAAANGGNGFQCTNTQPCCSQYGYCGATVDHCGGGCQNGFSYAGKCIAPLPNLGANLAYPFKSDSSVLAVSTDGLCGATSNSGKGSKCPAGSCCSQGGKCGTSIDYCGLVYFNCQVGYGDCSKPSDASNPLPALGSYPAVSDAASTVMRTNCDTAGQFVMGFDDGVSNYDPTILTTLAQKGVVGTFFINGYNWVDITVQPYSGILQQIYNAGHQIASHTFDHADLTKLNLDGLWAEMRRNDIAIQSVIGVAPLYVRVPFGSASPAVLRALSSWGYIAVWENIANHDTDHAGPRYSDAQQLQWSLGNYSSTLVGASPSSASFISLQHDQLAVTSQSFTSQAIDMVKGYGYQFVSLGQCLGSTKPNWYRRV